ncbi:MAG: hypothetical protein L0Y50_06900 [Beijerinckiaceae bacterium]|nr:hypothetical protein [Beijerinckiaceae bacterium]
MNSMTLGSKPGSQNFDPIVLVLMAAAGALVSVAITGFVFGINNNVFHLPIAGALYGEPQFENDAYTQSLRFYSAGPWLILSGVGKYVDLYWLFLALNYLARFVAFIGFLACAEALGIRTGAQRAIFITLLCLVSILRGSSYTGDGGLFGNFFSHSDFATGFTLVSLYFAARGRLTPAFAANGAVFFVNAFGAVWNALPLGMIALFLVVRRQISWRKAVVDGTAGLAAFCLLAAPVVWNIVSNPEFGVPIDFDYVIFLRQYWPLHFLFDASPLSHKFALVTVLLLGSLSFGALGRQADPFHLALWGYAAVYALGIAAPHITHNPTILTLHLIRVDTVFHLLAALGGTALATQWLTSSDPLHARFSGPVLVLLLCTNKYFALAAPFAVAATLWPAAIRLVPGWLVTGRFRLDYAVAAYLVFSWPYLIWTIASQNHVRNASVADWIALGEWVRANTPEGTTFFIQASDLKQGSSKGLSAHDGFAMLGNETFQYTSHRRVWVDFKRGAAVMWSPSYYKEWWPRLSESLTLISHDERLDYARRNAIDYVLEVCGTSEASTPLFRTGRICLYPVAKTSMAAPAALPGN